MRTALLSPKRQVVRVPAFPRPECSAQAELEHTLRKRLSVTTNAVAAANLPAPLSAKRGYNLFLLLVAGLGGLLYGIDVGIIGEMCIRDRRKRCCGVVNRRWAARSDSAAMT